MIFMLLQWPVSLVLKGKVLPERLSGVPYSGEGMALIAIAVFFASVAARVIGLPKRPNEAEMAVFHLKLVKPDLGGLHGFAGLSGSSKMGNFRRFEGSPETSQVSPTPFTTLPTPTWKGWS